MEKEIVFVSDIHLGGDGLLDHFEAEKEFISFLKSVPRKGKDVELIIVGDTFGLWEITTKSGIDKLKDIISNHKLVFDSFKKIGKKIKITIIPGNHDHELKFSEKYVKLLKEYNINLERKEYITRNINDKKIWIEHGNRFDPYNQTAHLKKGDFNMPLGYYFTNPILSNMSRRAIFGKFPWLIDLRSVHPQSKVPNWIFSSYFYKEMNPLIRYSLVPILAMFTFIIIILALRLLEALNFISIVFSLEKAKGFFLIGDVLQFALSINLAFILGMLFILIPLYFIVRDVKSIFARYGISSKSLRINSEEDIYNHAKKILDEGYSLFVFGHTHLTDIREFNGKYVINTGTWSKRFNLIKSQFRMLPDVFYPFYRLSYFRVFEDKGKIKIKHNHIKKKTKPNLSFLEKMVIFFRKKEKNFRFSRKEYTLR